MKYDKPQLMLIGPAQECVQASSKPAPHIQDNTLGVGYTASAYEADE
jgi:hypothetical protein